MSKKNEKTTCTYLEWSKMMSLIKRLERDKEYRFMLLISIGAFLGIRIGDIISLKWSDLLHKEELELNEQKTKKYRKIRLNNDLQKIVIKSYKALSPDSLDELIFINKYKTKAISVQYINRRFKQIAKKYKVGSAFSSTHVLRKSFAVAYYQKHPSEHSLLLISELFSHRSIATTRRYMGLREEELMNIYDDLTMF